MLCATVVAQWGNKYAAFRLSEYGRPETEDVYDPQDIRLHCLRWMMQTPLSKEKAIAMVDKLNGPRGKLEEV